MITKLITYLQNKCVPEVKFWIQQWIRDHIIDEIEPDDPNF